MSEALFRLGMLVPYGIATSWWMREYPSKEANNLHRWVLAAPVLIMNHLVPLLFSTTGADVVLRLLLTFLTAWLSNAKILAFCCNRGPLSQDYMSKKENWTISQYTALLHLPVLPVKASKVKKFQRSTNEDLQQKISQLVGKFAMMLAVDVSRRIMIPIWPWRELVYGWAIYAFMGFCMDASSLFGRYFLDMELVDNFNHPYLATSLAEFWSRWNLLTGLLLKCLSFDIVMEGRIVRDTIKNGEVRARHQCSTARLGLAVVSLFALSGVMHEMLYWYIIKKVIGHWFLFFFCLGPILVVEKMGLPLLQEHLGIKSLPKPIGTVYVALVMTITASYLFTPQAEVGPGTNLSTLFSTALAIIKLS